MESPASPTPEGSRLFAWTRLRFTLLASLPFALAIGASSATPLWIWSVRAATVGVAAMLAYGWFEQAPRQPSARIARWVRQLLGVVAAVPIASYVAYWATTGGDLRFWTDRLRLVGFAELCFVGILFAPWLALGAMVRQREALARDQALTFERERSTLEWQARDARLRLMQAQVQPHFLFNTLANVRALVAAGSPQAPAVLDSLIAYLRAAVPRLDDTGGTIDDEVALVRAYLELMHLRMPDRLQYALHADDAARSLRCPPTTLLTLVENAVRHGIDPGEDGGRIEVSVTVRNGRCCVRVIDTGIGLKASGGSTGTGLTTLRERLAFAFGGDVRLSLSAVVPHGACAELEFPAERPTPKVP